jgi:hypothetical protein
MLSVMVAIEHTKTARTGSGHSSVHPEVTDDELLDALAEPLQIMQRDEFDAEILNAASEVTDTNMFVAWRPSFAYLPPEKVGSEYHAGVFATGMCDNCPTDRLDVQSLQARLRKLVSSEHVYVDDYLDLFEWGSAPHWVID